MKGTDLLRAMNDIDEEWIAAADGGRRLSGAEGRDSGSRPGDAAAAGRSADIVRLRFRRRLSAGIIAAAAACAVIAFSMGPGAGDRAVEKGVTDTAGRENGIAESADAKVMLAMEAPEADYEADEAAEEADAGAMYAEYETMEDAASAGSLVIEAPEEFAGSDGRVIRCYGGTVTELVYRTDSGEELFRISKRSGASDAAAEGGDYAYTEDFTEDGCEVHVCGDEEDCISRAVWSRGGADYEVSSGVYLLSRQDVGELVAAVE